MTHPTSTPISPVRPNPRPIFSPSVNAFPVAAAAGGSGDVPLEREGVGEGVEESVGE